MQTPPKPAQQDLNALVDALNELRDSLVMVSLAMRDHLSEMESPERDAVLSQVESQLARIRESDTKPSD